VAVEVYAPLTAPVSGLLVPGMARIGAEVEARRSFFLDLMSLTALLCVPAFVGLALVARDLIEVLLDPVYAPAAGALAALSLIQALAPFGFFRNGVLAGLQRNGLRLAMALLDAAVTVGAVALAAAYGLDEAMIAWLGAAMALAALTTLVLCRVLAILPIRYLAAASPAYVAVAGMSLAVWGLQSVGAHWPALLRLVLCAGIGAAVYAAVLRLAFWDWTVRAIALLRKRKTDPPDASAESVVPAGTQAER